MAIFKRLASRKPLKDAIFRKNFAKSLHPGTFSCRNKSNDMDVF